MPGVRAVPVWDFPTRVFHWFLVLAVAVSYLSGGEDGWLFVVHTISGYLTALLLVFRLIWGFIGSPRSRFSDFVHGRRTVGDYVRRLMTLKPPKYIGHNPLGGWMIVLMLIVLSLTVLAGLFSGENGGASGLLLSTVAAPGEEGVGEIHELFANFILILAVIHIFGVFADGWLTGENLVPAMISGKKQLDETAARTEKPTAPLWRTLVAAVLVAAAGTVLFAKTDFAALATASMERHQTHDHEDND